MIPVLERVQPIRNTPGATRRARRHAERERPEAHVPVGGGGAAV